MEVIAVMRVRTRTKHGIEGAASRLVRVFQCLAMLA
jgi:hypothetical protein